MPDYDYTQHLLEVARMMELAARTAPKSKGTDFVEARILTGELIEELARAMLEFGGKSKKKDFDRDADNVRRSPVVLLLGLKDSKTLGLNCSACGFADCSELEKAEKVEGEFRGPICAFRLLDFGIAMGSAVKTAQMLNADNRIMYRIGVAAIDAGMIDWEIAMGIPLSATGKNIYFDRKG